MMETNATEKSSCKSMIDIVKDEHSEENAESLKTELGSVKATHVSDGQVEEAAIKHDIDPVIVESSKSVKRQNHGQVANAGTIWTGTGITGCNHQAKRGKREWLSFRGSRRTRVGDDYQVTSLPSTGTSTRADDTTSSKGDDN